MGLRADLRASVVTAGLLAVAAIAALLAPPAPRATTERDGRAELPFHGDGAQGPIEGVVIVEDGRIVEVEVTRSDEGVDRRALSADRLDGRFRGLPARAPLAADAISGATISSRRLIEAVERRLGRGEEDRRAR